MGMRRKRYTQYHQATKDMLELYGNGVPRFVICQDYRIGDKTLRRLINEYEAVNGPLRKNKIVRQKKQK